MPRSYDIQDALALFERIEGLLLPMKEELDIAAMSSRYSDRRSNRITLYLVPADEGRLSTDEVTRKVKAMLPKDIPGVRFKSGRTWGSSSTGAGVEIKGRNPDVLAMLAEDIRLRLQDIRGVHEVETSLESGNEEIQVSINRRRARRYGLTPWQVATTVASALGTRGNSKFKTENGEIDIAVQLKEEDRATLEQLRNTYFESDTGNMVSFASLADFRVTKGSSSARTREPDVHADRIRQHGTAGRLLRWQGNDEADADDSVAGRVLVADGPPIPLDEPGTG